MNKSNKPFPFAYFITFTCYGARSHGDARGSVDRLHNIFETPCLKKNLNLVNLRKKQMSKQPYLLDSQKRNVVLSAIQKTCRHFDWFLFAAHIRTNHVHSVVKAEVDPRIIMTQFKARASRALNKIELSSYHQKRWTRHGSTRYIWSSKFLIPVIKYIVEEQGEPMCVYCDPCYEVDDMN